MLDSSEGEVEQPEAKQPVEELPAVKPRLQSVREPLPIEALASEDDGEEFEKVSSGITTVLELVARFWSYTFSETTMAHQCVRMLHS